MEACAVWYVFRNKAGTIVDKRQETIPMSKEDCERHIQRDTGCYKNFLAKMGWTMDAEIRKV